MDDGLFKKLFFSYLNIMNIYNIYNIDNLWWFNYTIIPCTDNHKLSLIYTFLLWSHRVQFPVSKGWTWYWKLTVRHIILRIGQTHYDFIDKNNNGMFWMSRQITIKPIIIIYQPDLVIGDSLIADMIEPSLLIPLPLDSAISSALAFFAFLPLVDFLFSLSVFSAYKK